MTMKATLHPESVGRDFFQYVSLAIIFRSLPWIEEVAAYSPTLCPRCLRCKAGEEGMNCMHVVQSHH